MIMLMKLLLYTTVAVLSVLGAREVLYLRRRSPPKLSRQLTAALNQTKTWYHDDPKLDQQMSAAGLDFLSGWTYKLCRDLVALLVVMALHIQFLLTGQYPLTAMLFIAILYVLSLTGRNWMPFTLLLNLLQQERTRKKNDDVVLLFMLFYNDAYTETDTHHQSVISKLQAFRNDMQALRKDVDELISDYKIDGAVAFGRFGERVNTKEAKQLSIIMEKMNQSNPQTTVDLLEQHYDTFLDYRRQRRKRQLRANGHLGFAIVFVAIIAVVFLINAISGAYQDMLYETYDLY